MDHNNKHTKNSWGREGRLYVVEISEKAACAYLEKFGKGFRDKQLACRGLGIRLWGRGLGTSNWDVATKTGESNYGTSGA
jgi:hypothetical protein